MNWEVDYCHLSDIHKEFCHHCVTNARNLGHVRELLGFSDDDDDTPL